MTSAYDMWHALTNVFEDNNQIETEVKDSRPESEDKEEQNLTLMVNDKESFSPIVIDETTTVSQNKEMTSEQQKNASTSSSNENKIYLNHFYDSDECVEIDSSINDSSIFLKNIMTCENY